MANLNMIKYSKYRYLIVLVFITKSFIKYQTKNQIA